MHMTVFGGVVALFFAVQLYAFRKARRGWTRFVPVAATGAGLLLFLMFGAVLTNGYFAALIALLFGAGFIGSLLGLAAAALTRGG